MGQINQEIHSIFAEILKIDANFDDDTLFIELGGQSILMGELQSAIEQRFSVQIPFEKLFEFGSVNGLAELIDLYNKNIIVGNNDVDFEVHPEKRFDSHPMTDLQIAYYVGRQSDTELGGNPTRGYSEIVCKKYDHLRMQDAINKLFERHDVLRCRFKEDGTQQVERTIDTYVLKLDDISILSEEEQEKYLLEKREKIFNSLFDVHQLPLVYFEATKCADDKTIIHFSHDGLIIDGWSHEMIIHDLDLFYSDPSIECKQPGIFFSDYVHYLEQVKKTDKYQEDREYWMSKMGEDFARPSLPLKQDPSQVKVVNTRQVVRYIDGDVWESVKLFANKNKLTPFSVIFTAFGKAILKYSKGDKFLINMPVSIRPNIHPEIDELIGECSNFFLFNFDNTQGTTILENARHNQVKIAEIMQHNYFLGTDYIRELQKTEGASVAAPIVFTSIIDVPERTPINLRKVYTKTHTSQVWIDAIAMRNGDGIMLTMDCVADLFEESLTDGIGDSFVQLLENIHADQEYLNTHNNIDLTDNEKNTISDCVNATTAAALPLLSELLLKSYNENKNRPAVVSEGKTYSYHEAYQEATCIANEIRKKISTKNSCEVAVFLGKGKYQILSALASAMCNCAYFPLDIQLPEEQLKACVNTVGIRVIITDSKWYSKLKQYFDCTIINVDEIVYSYDNDVFFDDSSANDISYMINTSGTTGVPKSIRLKQAGLVNCLIETGEHFRLSQDDCFIAITNYCHDMSVYDMYGSLVVGASVVFPDFDREKDPYHWLELIRDNNVTFWNSAPALLEILLETDVQNKTDCLASVRNILTGGDWISIALAKNIKSNFVNAQLSSVGGPSETTIWNIWHTVKDEDLERTFIPYGKPIAYTNYYVLDANGMLCPPFVEGVMFVEGIGVAEGYVGLDEENKKKFVLYNGKRVYNTGDRGLYLEDGSIRILGRVDQQVKINGKRIELEGIKEMLNKIEGINSSAVIVSSKTKSLVAFYTGDSSLGKDYITEELKRMLPNYMIPTHILHIEAMPLTKNGKVDAGALDNIDIVSVESPVEIQGDNREIEIELLEMCKEIFGNDAISIEDSFFEMGGNSITAIKILSQIKKKYGVMLTIYDILNTPQIQQWGELIESERK